MATRWGIISVGKISNDFVVALRTLPAEEHQIIAVAAKSQERVQEFAKKYDIPNAYSSYESLAQNPNIDDNNQPLDFQQSQRRVKVTSVNDKGDTNLKLQIFLKAVWSNFVPSYIQMEKELNKNTIGEVRAVQSSFGFRVHDPSRATVRSLGGNATLDIGIYTLNVALRAFKRERPIKINATGYTNDEGVDEVASIAMLYSNGRLAHLHINLTSDLDSEAIIYGTKGKLKLPYPFWSTETLITPSKTYDFPIVPPRGNDVCVYTNSTNLRYEAEEVRRCILAGLLESPRMTHEDTLFLAECMTEIQKQLGSDYAPQLE